MWPHRCISSLCFALLCYANSFYCQKYLVADTLFVSFSRKRSKVFANCVCCWLHFIQEKFGHSIVLHLFLFCHIFYHNQIESNTFLEKVYNQYEHLFCKNLKLVVLNIYFYLNQSLKLKSGGKMLVQLNIQQISNFVVDILKKMEQN